MGAKYELIAYKILAAASTAGGALVTAGTLPAKFAAVFVAAGTLAAFFHAEASRA